MSIIKGTKRSLSICFFYVFIAFPSFAQTTPLNTDPLTAVRRPLDKIATLNRLEAERQSVTEWAKVRVLNDAIFQIKREISDWRLDRWRQLDRFIEQSSTQSEGAQQITQANLINAVTAIYESEPAAERQADALQWGFRLARLGSPLATTIYKTMLAEKEPDDGAVSMAVSYFLSQPAAISVIVLEDFLRQNSRDNRQIIDILNYLEKADAIKPPLQDLLAQKYVHHTDPYVAETAIGILIRQQHPAARQYADQLLRRTATRDKSALRVVVIGRLTLDENIQLFGDLMMESPEVGGKTDPLQPLQQPIWPVRLAIARKIVNAGGNADLVAPLIYAVSAMKQWPYANDLIGSGGYREPIFPELFVALALSTAHLEQDLDSQQTCATNTASAAAGFGSERVTTMVSRLQSSESNTSPSNKCRLLQLSGEVLAFHLRSFIYVVSAISVDNANLDSYGSRERIVQTLRRMADSMNGKYDIPGKKIAPMQSLPRRLLADLVSQAKEQNPQQIFSAGLSESYTRHGTYLESGNPLLQSLADCRRPLDYYGLTQAVHRRSDSVEKSATVIGDLRLLRTQVCLGDNVHHFVAEFLLALEVVPLSGRPNKSSYVYHANADDAADYIEGVIWVHAEMPDQSSFVEVPQIGVYLAADAQSSPFLPLAEVMHAVDYANHYYGPHRLLMALGRSLIRMMATTAAVYLEQDLVAAADLYELTMPQGLVDKANSKSSTSSAGNEREAITLAGSNTAIDTAYIVAGVANYQRAWQGSFSRHQGGRTYTMGSSERAVKQLLSEDYLPLLDGFEDICKGCSPREYATVLWRTKIANSEDDAAKMLHEHLSSIDLFGGGMTEDVWDVIVEAYYRLPTGERTVERLYEKVQRPLRAMLAERVADKVSKLHEAILKIAEVETTEELLRLVGGPKELLIGVATETATQGLLGHYEAFYQEYIEQGRVDRNNMIIRGLIEGGITVLLIPVGGAFFQAIKLSARAASAASAIGSATRLTEAMAVGANVGRASFPTLARVTASGARLSWNLSRGAAIAFGRRSLIAGLGSYALVRADLADAEEDASLADAQEETSLSESVPWRHERAGFGDEQCFLLTSAENDRLQAECEMRQITDWSFVGLSVVFSAQLPLLRSIGQRPLSWTERLIATSTTLGSYPALRMLAGRIYKEATTESASNTPPNFFETTPENRLFEIYDEAARLNMSPQKVLETTVIKQAISDLQSK